MLRLHHKDKFQTLHKLNAPSEDESPSGMYSSILVQESPGSPYLQARIYAAHKATA